MAAARPSLIEFPADNPERARRFWSGVLGAELEPRHDREGEGWQTHLEATDVGVHARGRGPGDSFSLPYFTVDDMPSALERVIALGGAVVHPGERWAVCRDSREVRSASRSRPAPDRAAGSGVSRLHWSLNLGRR
jgi:predicted enzyme related to lactoylglutathione lyase